ncbi:MAG: thiamine diphosphokinase [Lachnospiraceae bacterium]|nr:thiamine diphosphokinase [Lachnospiraceae bacterium]
MDNSFIKKIDTQNIRLLDMHTHLFDMRSESAALSEIEYRRKAGIFSVYCAKNPVEWDFFEKLGLKSISGMAMLSFGIHPWESARYDPADYENIYKHVSVIGEIGLDNVWTDVPFETQRRVFEKQLEIASFLKKPAILHTKGCEDEIAGMLRGFDQPVLIHWYSGGIDALRALADLGCYFTLGPNACCPGTESGLINEMLSLIPRERLLTETDGLESIFWERENNRDFKLAMPDETFAANGRESTENELFSLIFDSLFTTAKRIADHDSVDIRSTVAQSISAFLEFVGVGVNNENRCLIIAGGEEGPIPLSEDFPFIIAVDKGMEYAKKTGIVPDILIGDLDSLDPRILVKAQKELSGNIISLPEHKNDSDLQSGVKYALERGYGDLVICCAMGGRFDHMLANLQVCAYAALRGAVCSMISADNEVYVFSERTMVFPRKEEYSFSVFALSERCVGVDISGAVYSVSAFTLSNNLSRGLSNGWASDRISVSVKKGVLAVIMSKL